MRSDFFKRGMCILLVVMMLIALLPRTTITVMAAVNEEQPVINELEGKTISILGASISTYDGISNNTAYNSTIGNNAVYYTAGRHGVYADDTWWMQAADDLGLEILVNNSWSGSSLLYERSGTVGAYVDRCIQLHNDMTNEEPDMIAIQMGTNDFQYYKDTLGTADINYDDLIMENEDGTFTYTTPVTSLEAAAIVLHKISVRYPEAEVYYLNISQRVDGTDELIRAFNAELKQVVEHFGAHIVDIYNSAITMDDFDTYIGDGRVHPNQFGMDAYTEAFKSAVLSNNSYGVEGHMVSFELTDVQTDYGTDQWVVCGDSFSCALTAEAGKELSVSVTMGGTEITDTVYEDGVVTIESVTADVVITAVGTEHISQEYRWEFDGSDLVCINGDNALTKNAGTTTEGVFNTTRYALDQAVHLLHDREWVVEWKSEGTFENTGGKGARIFTSDDVNANYNARYIFKSPKNWILAMGEKTSSGSHNYGIALADHNIDGSAPHTYRLENRIAEDGSNMVYLFVDEEEIGPMNNYYIGTTSQNTTSDWLCGQDFVLPYMGTDTHGFTNCSIEYIQVWEEGRNEDSSLENYEGKVISILGDSISTFAGYIPTADGFNLEHLTRYPQDNLLTDVIETWWMQVVIELDAKLGINDSWRGATVSGDKPVTTGSTGENAAMGNLQRIQNLGANGTPDMILFYGGTNDLAHVSKVGTFDAANAPTMVDLTTAKWDNLADGYVHTLLRLQYYYPEALIVALLPTYTNGYYSDEKLAEGNAVLAEICEHYGVSYVDLRECGISTADLPDNIHPNATGMDYITEAVLDVLYNDCWLEAGENIVHSVTHELTNAESSMGYYKGISHGRSFTTTITGDDVTVTVTMGGVDITNTVYDDGVISIEEVTDDVVIKAEGRLKAIYEDHLQQIPEAFCSETNLWAALEHDEEYYAVNGWRIHNSGTVYSVTIPVSEGEMIYATSFGAAGNNGGSINGIRATWFNENGVLQSVSADKVFDEFSNNGYLTAPEGAVAICIPMWEINEDNEVYILNREHLYENNICVTEPTCTEKGYTTYTCEGCGESYMSDYTDALGHDMGEWEQIQAPTCYAEGKDQRICDACGLKEYRDTRISGDPNKILVSSPVSEDYYSGKRILLIGDSITYGVGVNDRNTEVYGCVLAEKLGMQVSNKGVSGSGYCTGGAMATNKTLTEANVSDADVITIMLGVNDWAWSVKEGSWNGNPDYYDKSKTYYQLGEFDSADTSTFYGALHAWCQEINSMKQIEGFEDKQFVLITPLITSWNNSVGQRDWDQNKLNIHGHTFREYCNAILEVGAYYGIPVFDANMFSGIYYRGADDTNVDVAGGDGVHVNAEGHALLAKALEEFLLEGYSYETRVVNDLGHSYEKGICENCHLPQPHQHSYTAEVTVPTCTEQGYTTYICISCGDTYVSDYTAVLGHKMTEWIVTKEAKCEETGEEQRSCERCDLVEKRTIEAKGHKEVIDAAVDATCTTEGKTESKHCSTCNKVLIAQIVIPALGHDMGGWKQAQAPSCTENGNEKRECSRCNHSETREVEAKGHNYTSKITEPSCTEKGYTTYDCESCGDTYVSDYTAALGHKMTEWIVTKEAKCEEIGEEQRSCERCDLVEKRTIEAKDHKGVIDAGVNATCTTEGKTEGKHCATCKKVLIAQTVIPALGHDMGDWKQTQAPSCTENGNEQRECSCCDYSETREVEAKGHNYSSKMTESGCTEKGYTTYDCESCGDTYVSDYTDALGHNMTKWHVTKEVKCEETGEEQRNCERCDLVEKRTIAAPGHKEVIDAGVDATCTTEGKTEGKHCATCKKVLIAQTVIPALGHDMGDWKQTQVPSCTENGNEKRECSHCDYSETREVEAKGHNYTTIVTEPNCTKQGCTTYTCESCGDTYVSDYTDALGHKMTEWIVTKEAKCEETGEEQRNCERCDLTETREVTALGHKEVIDAAVDATCTTEGKTEGKHCSTCNKVLIAQTVIPTLGHNYTLVVTEPNCTEQGYTTYTCINCGNSYVSDYTEVLGHRYESTLITAPGETKTFCECGAYEEEYITGWILYQGEYYYRFSDEPQTLVTKDTVIGNTVSEFDETGVWKGYAKAGWKQLEDEWYYLSSGGQINIGWQRLGKTWYYFNEKGVMQTGWLLKGSTWYYLNSTGGMMTGSVVIDGAMSEFDENGAWKGYAKAGWKQVGENWYYLGSGGKIITGWKLLGKTWYYFNANGIMQTGWLQLGNTWYYLNTSGGMVTGSVIIDGVMSDFNSGGVWLGYSKSGWKQVNNQWYYLGSGGKIATGWKLLGKTWYYFNANGIMQTGWLQLGSTWYYLNSSGGMVTGSYVIDGSMSEFAENGAWKGYAKAGWKQVGENWYYLGSGGKVSVGWQRLGKTWYYFNEKGVMQTGWLLKGSTWYYLNSTGGMVTGVKVIDGVIYKFNSAGALISQM